MLNELRCLLVRFGLRCAALVCVVAAAGCANMTPGTSGSSVDRERLSNLVALDDVSEVRALVEARVISVNEMIPGVGYGATPLITVAARHASLNVL